MAEVNKHGGRREGAGRPAGAPNKATREQGARLSELAKSLIFRDIWAGNGGETGIRTLEGCYTLLVFKTSAFNRSAIPPTAIAWLR